MYEQGNSLGVNTWTRDFACKIPGPSQNLTSSHKTLTVANIILLRRCNICVCTESGVIKTSPRKASIGAILDTRENERFETFSTLFLHYYLSKHYHQTCFSDTLTSTGPLGSD